MRLELTIYVEPKGKARPRTVSKAGRTWTYTPKATTDLEFMIRQAVMKKKQYFDRSVPLKLEATFYLAKPKSAPKKRLLPITRPDIDNCNKLLLDSLEKYVFANDSQLTSCIIRKRYDTIPRIHLIIEEDKEGK